MAKLTGTNPDQVPTNADLGDMAYKDGDNLQAGPLTITDGKVGIGTSSLSNVLHVHQSDATSNSYVHITQADGGSAATDGLSIGIEDGGVNAVIRNRENGYLRMYTNNTERMRIDSSGNVGIGTISPDYRLEVEEAGTGSGLGGIAASTATTGGSAGYRWATGGTTRFGMTLIGSAGSESLRIYDSNNSTERMRIDSSGNLLVGQSTADSTSNGHGLLATGRAYHTMISAHPLQLNRKTSDGDIAIFQKDGSTVGRIGTDGALNIGSTSTGIKFGTSAVWATTGGSTNSNGSKDLGASTARWKDLYLSGGVYLGGIGSLNKLDDYEYGTFTPTYGSSGTQPSGITYDTVVGNKGIYVKNGRAVFVQINIRTDAVTSVGTGSLYISGLPFSTPNLSGQGGIASFYVGSSGQFATNQPTSAQMDESSTNILLFYRTSSNGDTVSMTTSELQNAANTNFIRLSGVYYTTD